MAESVHVLEEHVRTSRRSLEANLRELQDRAETAADWRTQYRRHLGAFVGAALLGGVILGALTRAQRGAPPRRGIVNETATRVVDALTATAMSAVVDVIADLIPGFDHEYQARPASRI